MENQGRFINEQDYQWLCQVHSNFVQGLKLQVAGNEHARNFDRDIINRTSSILRTAQICNLLNGNTASSTMGVDTLYDLECV